MAHKHKGQLAPSNSWAKHLRKRIKGKIAYKRRFWHRERQALRESMDPNSKYEF
jgi:hypothetical protein